MTEAEWTACDELQRMLPCLWRRVSERKARLFAVACCRRIWHLYRKPGVREAILVGERYADGQADVEERRAALRTVHKERAMTPTGTPWGSALHAAGFTVAELNPEYGLSAVSEAITALTQRAADAERETLRREEERAYCALVRDFFGPLPFRTVSLDPRWRTPDVLALARAAYQERDLPAGTLDGTRLAVLADALEDAGCTDAEVLAHLRSEGPHVRGCWVLDLVLGKE